MINLLIRPVLEAAPAANASASVAAAPVHPAIRELNEQAFARDLISWMPVADEPRWGSLSASDSDEEILADATETPRISQDTTVSDASKILQQGALVIRREAPIGQAGVSKQRFAAQLLETKLDLLLAKLQSDSSAELTEEDSELLWKALDSCQAEVCEKLLDVTLSLTRSGLILTLSPELFELLGDILDEALVVLGRETELTPAQRQELAGSVQEFEQANRIVETRRAAAPLIQEFVSRRTSDAAE